jgi:methylaspartate ammonia-lyase
MIHIKTPDVGSLADIVDATLYCKSKKQPVLLGGSCIETALSTRATIHIGMVTRPDMFLVKPGMGIDEGYMLCQGEMARIAAESRDHGRG